MMQFVSHCAQQLRHAKGFLEGLPCPEEFRHIQKTLFLSCAGNRDHLGMKEFTCQFQEHVQSIQFGHDNICDDQVRRPVAVPLKPLTTVYSFRDLVPFRLKSGTEEHTNGLFVIDDQNHRQWQGTLLLLGLEPITFASKLLPWKAVPSGEQCVCPATRTVAGLSKFLLFDIL